MADTIRSAREFFGDVQVELQKVTWPDRAQLKNSTWIILVFVVVLALLIFGVDFIVNQSLQVLHSVLGG